MKVSRRRVLYQLFRLRSTHCLRGLLNPGDQACPSKLIPSSKKVRGMSRKSLDLIETMTAIARITKPITGRGIGYQLFTRGLIASTSRSDMQRVYRLLKLAREDGMID